MHSFGDTYMNKIAARFVIANCCCFKKKLANQIMECNLLPTVVTMCTSFEFEIVFNSTKVPESHKAAALP